MIQGIEDLAEMYSAEGKTLPDAHDRRDKALCTSTSISILASLGRFCGKESELEWMEL